MEDLTKGLKSKSNRKHKKGKKDSGSNEAKKGRKNSRAFNVSNINATKRNMQRNLDRAQKKEVVPLINREEELPPPAFVVVMGPTGVGKSTLIRSLVKMYTNQNLTDTVGPITVITGKKKRVTFFEAPTDLYSLADLAKVADLVILMIDGSYGLEMETFEYINMLQVHGFPKILGCLTHMDLFKSNKALQGARKALKHRFWTEIYKGAKMFDFMGVVNNKFRKHEVKRLALHISRVKFRPLVWHNTHPYVCIDRVEDVTSVDHANEETRDVAFYGYLRGTHLKETMKVHLLGAGDFDMASCTMLPDPCPSITAGASQQLSLKKKKETLLYAPMANVGRVTVAQDGDMYIELKEVHYSKRDNIAVEDQEKVDRPFEDDGEGDTPMDMLRRMQDVKKGAGVDEQLQRRAREVTLFGGSAARSDLGSEEDGEEDEEDEEGENEEGDDYDEEEEGYGEADLGDGYDEEGDNRDADSAEEEDEMDDEEDDQDEDEEDDDSEDDSEGEEEEVEAEPAEGLERKHKLAMLEASDDIMQTIYGASWNAPQGGSRTGKGRKAAAVDEDSDDEELFQPMGHSKKQTRTEDIDALDSNRITHSYLLHYVRMDATAEDKKDVAKRVKAYEEGSAMGSSLVQGLSAALSSSSARKGAGYYALKSRFVTGGYGQLGSGEGEDGEGEGLCGDDEAGNGDWEDLEATESKGATKGKGKGKGKASVNEDDDDDNDEENERLDEELRQMYAQKKAGFKAKFDDKYDKKKRGEGDGSDDEDQDDNGDGTGKKNKKKSKTADVTDDQDLDAEDGYLAKVQQDFQSMAQRNKAEFKEDSLYLQQQYLGHTQGRYLRIIVKGMPRHLLDNFNKRRPMILGGLLNNEVATGFVVARIKRHRWNKGVLKSGDPLIVSIGWRRYQSLPVFHMPDDDSNPRSRFIKYTPEHMHCQVCFYGPLVPPNTPLFAFKAYNQNTAHFRIAMTGVTLEQRTNSTIVKKLKLVGTPVKIFKNTAFITGMFNSELEVAKFEHVKVKTVSGVRGSIKKAVTNAAQLHEGKAGKGLPKVMPGTFRATFEDKILMSDMVTCRIWVPVPVKEWFSPVHSLMVDSDTLKADSAEGLVLMKNTGQLRKERQVAIPVNKDSLYKPIVRQEREFKKLLIPSKLQAALPFASKPKNNNMPEDRNKRTEDVGGGNAFMRGSLSLQKRNKISSRMDSEGTKVRAVISEPEERKQRALLSMLSTIKKDKTKKREVAQQAKQKEKAKAQKRISEKFEDVHKMEKKRKYKEDGLKAMQAKRKRGEM